MINKSGAESISSTLTTAQETIHTLIEKSHYDPPAPLDLLSEADSDEDTLVNTTPIRATTQIPKQELSNVLEDFFIAREYYPIPWMECIKDEENAATESDSVALSTWIDQEENSANASSAARKISILQTTIR